ncbi:MAG: winged helix-turn-helix domain-containing protein [Thermoleophilia bacterium]
MPDGSEADHASHRAHGGARSHNRRSVETTASAPGATTLNSVHAACRIWLEQDGVRVFGPGTHELLWRVQKKGSLNQAAKEMAMSYSKAWRITHEVEERLGVTLFERSVGGADGGGSRLTDDGRLLLERFSAFAQESDTALDTLYRKYFADITYAATSEVPAEHSHSSGSETELSS